MDYLNAQINSQPKNGKGFFSGPKIIFVILGIIILGEVIYATRTLTFSTPSLPSIKTNVENVQKGAAKISLNTTKSSFNVNEAIPVTATIDTNSKTISGADLIIHYDPQILEASSANLVKGKIFDEYPLLSVDKTKGLISISGVSSSKNNFTGSGQFAVINIKAKRAGKTSLTIDFKKGSTANSILAETTTSSNILDSVDNLVLNIQ